MLFCTCASWSCFWFGWPAAFRGTAVLFLCVLTAVVYAILLGWENTVWGFQSSFYFVFGFSMFALWALYAARPFSLRWLGGVVLSVAAYISMASGALTLIAVTALLGLQVVFRVRPRSLSEIGSVVVLAFSQSSC